ncbi:hypothetical protein M9H77_02111 [Catharanthus roseus]|uniref:Uncharacterized protein n=1 Tax=Catharanthus roseus TaxID=4058 RepID=A0ACC0C7F8_CATRO|nr:hypothetical protein M9H77_02111 [Catharanthus roseus]
MMEGMCRFKWSPGAIGGKESTNLGFDHIYHKPIRPSRSFVAEPANDEVFAQITLIPEDAQDHLPLTEYPGLRPPQIPEPKFFSFSKDMNQQTPSQELKAKDLHVIEWTFKQFDSPLSILKICLFPCINAFSQSPKSSQPKRHLFTTGWSNFVNSKGLVAGDSFVFLRGENGELRVGIRRLSRPCISKPSSCFPSESVGGVLATIEPLGASIPLTLVPPVESKRKCKTSRTQVQKRRKKCMKHLGEMTKELAQPIMLSSESARKNHADMSLSLLWRPMTSAKILAYKD